MALPIFVVPFTGYILLNTTCIKHFPLKEYQKSHVPDEEELVSLCPGILRYLDCYRTELLRTPANFTEFDYKFYNSSGSLLRELCTVGKYVREAYLRSHKCFKSLDENGEVDLCSEKGENTYQIWKNGLPALEQNGLKEEGKKCFTERMKAECIRNQVFRLCEIFDYHRFTGFLDKSGLRHAFCDNSSVESEVSDYLSAVNVYLLSKGLIASASILVTPIQYLTTAIALLLFLMHQSR